MAKVRFYRGTQDKFDSLEEVDPDGLYFISGNQDTETEETHQD